MARHRIQVPAAFYRLSGRVPDRLVAAECGASEQTVSRWRRLAGIKPTVRSGAGAPRVAGGAAETVTVNLSPALKRRVLGHAGAAGLSASAWLRALIEAELGP